MSVQIQCKRSLNQKTDRYIERLENNGGGKECAGLVFPHPTIFKNQLHVAKHLVKLAINKLGFLLDIFKSS